MCLRVSAHTARSVRTRCRCCTTTYRVHGCIDLRHSRSPAQLPITTSCARTAELCRIMPTVSTNCIAVCRLHNGHCYMTGVQVWSVCARTVCSFDGGPVCAQQLVYCPSCTLVWRQMQMKRQHERATFQALTRHAYDGQDAAKYAVSTAWMREWEQFVNGHTPCELSACHNS